MRNLFLPFLFTLTALCTLQGRISPTVAATPFEEGKTYVINRNGNESAYISDNGSNMSTTTLDDNGNIFWLFEPSANDGCFYIKNARTGKYIQSAVVAGLSNLVSLGDTKTEYKAGHDNTGDEATWWLASTDNGTIQTDTDGPLGLNFGATGVVSYYIKTGRGNSYWTITQRDMPGVTPDPDSDDALLTNLSQLKNGKAYTIKSQRGVLYCTATQLWGSAGVSGFTESATNTYQQFAILTSAKGKYYLYNIGAQKFVQASVTLSDTPSQWNFVLNPSGDYRWMLNSKGNYINMQIAGQQATNVVVNSWSTADAGNRLQITAVADVNVDAALAAIEQYEEDLTKPVAKPALAKRLGLVRIPCGNRGAYLTSLSLADYSYAASQAPTSGYINFPTTDFVTLNAGETYTLTLTAANTTTDTDIRLFVDWNGDGVYEPIVVEEGSVTITVPKDAIAQDTYLRLRLNDNGLLEMDHDYEGTVYDFRMRIQIKEGTGVSTVNTCANAAAPTYSIDGKRVHNPRHPGIYIASGKKYVVR